MSPSRSALRSHALVALAALVLGAGLGAAIVRWRSSRAETPRTIAMPVDPESYVPSDATAMLVADVDRLRSMPLVSALWTSGGAVTGCEARLLARVRRVAVAFGDDVSEFGVVFAGTLAEAELTACARSRMPPGAEFDAREQEGVRVIRILSHPDAGFVPRSDAPEIVYLPNGTVLAGSASMLQRMLDHARGGGPVVVDAPLASLRARLGGSFDLVLVARATDAWTALAQDRFAALRGVAGVSVGIRLSPTEASVRALIACRDYDAPRGVADTLQSLQHDLPAVLGVPALGPLLADLTIERGATDVIVRAAVPVADLTTLWTAVRSSAAGPSTSGRAAP